ncbi:MAG: CDP-diacylglycerol--glycerol-3-phosphate 3-phosphatidyltransferase [Verrucomicrobiota bacterium]
MVLNLPNLLTLSRVPLTFLIVWLMYQTWPGAASLAFWMFIAAAVSDWADGYVARRQGIVSNFGKFMDALTDKVLVIGLMVAFVSQPEWRIPVPYVLITLCREFLVSGMRMVAASKGVVVQADRGGKTKTMTQMIAIGFLLATPMVAHDWAAWAPGVDFTVLVEAVHQIGLIGFAIGTFLAVWSGYRYMRASWHLMVDEEPKK